jgi:predicted phosphoribosyltransferase
MRFASRQDAGERLGQDLACKGLAADLVLGLARGGVVVAEGVAGNLRCPLDVLVVRKIGHPNYREFALGALGEGGVAVLDETVLRRAHVRHHDLDTVIQEERLRLGEYEEKFARPGRPGRQGKAVVVVDDGLATGATLQAALQSVANQGARRIVAAVPVASTTGAERIANSCDEFYALLVDPAFEAVGQYYDSFDQTTDEEVLEILRRGAGQRG